MDSLSLGPVEYAQTAITIGEETDLSKVDYATILPRTTVLAMAMPASTSVGRPLQRTELDTVLSMARMIIEMNEQRQSLLIFLEGRMSKLAPNVTAIVGTKVASRLIALTGGVTALSKIPAGNIQVLGRIKRKDLAGFSLAHANVHTGVIWETDLVGSTPVQYRNQAQRLISNKVALAARIDSIHQSPEGTYGRQLRQEIIGKLEKLIEPAPMAKVKPIPPPPIETSKKRGGRRARRQKELYGQTQIRKMTNRLEFGRPEQEIVVGSSVVGLGELGSGSAGGSGGRIRAPTVDSRLREQIKKESQKAYPQYRNLNDKSATSAPIVSTSSEGAIQIIRQSSSPPPAWSSTGTKYFGTNVSFRKS